MEDKGFSSTDLLGELNALERKYAPKQLFLAGDRSLLTHPRVAIVGTRQAGPAALRRAARLSRILVRHDIVVVSGLAAGVDAAAHRAAIAAGSANTQPRRCTTPP